MNILGKEWTILSNSKGKDSKKIKINQSSFKVKSKFKRYLQSQIFQEINIDDHYLETIHLLIK